MEPNCCPHCAKVLTDDEVKTLYSRLCLSRRKDRGGKPALADVLKPMAPTEADRAWARAEIAKRAGKPVGITLDYEHPDW